MASSSRYRTTYIKPTFQVTKTNGVRIITTTQMARISFKVLAGSYSDYLGLRLFDKTASVGFPAVYYPMYDDYLFVDGVEYPNGSNISIPAPSSSTTHTLIWQTGVFQKTSRQYRPIYDWYAMNSSPTYTVSVPAKDIYNITYYYKNGSIFTSTTGGEGDNHTVLAGTGIGGFDHWNTAADDTGTSYSPGATRFIDGDLYFYAICNGIVVRRKINGEWKDCSVQAKVNGEWVPVIEGYIKVNGVWKPIVE